MAGHNYKLLESLYYDNRDEYMQLYNNRMLDDNCIKLDFYIGDNQAFFMETAELMKSCMEIARIDKEIAKLCLDLPGIATKQYANKCLIDEIVITNNIEGVHSTRKEIGELLEELKPKIPNRFSGLVHKYLALNDRLPLTIDNCQDIRNLYDKMFLDEVIRENPKDKPDGELFRKGPVSILDAKQKEIHEGILPESKIIDAMDRAIVILNDEKIEPLFRVAIFHYLFGYIHPFYNGNGRLNRFISSCYLSYILEPIMGYRLSYTIKENINSYYKGFKIVNKPINKGDITPFIYIYIDIIKESAENLRDGLTRRSEQFHKLEGEINALPYGEDGKYCDLYYLLLQAALFSENGISIKDLVAMLNISKPTLSNRIRAINEEGLIKETNMDKHKFYSLDIDRMKDMLDQID